MKHYGHIDLQQNELQNAVVPVDTYFPANPVVGQLVFKNKVLYICLDIDAGLPIWCPLTNVVDSYIHNQDAASATWNISHNLNSGTVSVQVFDTNGRMLLPNDITIVDKDTVTVTFNTAIAGRASVLIGNMVGAPAPTYGYEYTQTSPSTTWTVNHGLGYYPVVRVFIGSEEVQPAQIIHDSVNSLRIIFTAPYVGVAKCI
jgi:hypothetical protein